MAVAWAARRRRPAAGSTARAYDMAAGGCNCEASATAGSASGSGSGADAHDGTNSGALTQSSAWRRSMAAAAAGAGGSPWRNLPNERTNAVKLSGA